MATAKKIAKHRRRKAKRRSPKSFLSGIIPSATANGIVDILKKTGCMVAGFIGGREISRAFFKPKDGVATVEGFQKFIAPFLKAGGGYLLAHQKNDVVKFIGYGLLAEGVIDGVGKIMKKDLLNEGLINLKGFDITGLLNGSDDDQYGALPELPSYAPSEVEGMPLRREAQKELVGVEEDFDYINPM